MDSIGTGRGGLTKATFKRFRQVAEGKRAILVTVAYQPNLHQIFSQLKRDGELPPHAELLSFHDDLRHIRRDRSKPLNKMWTDWEADRNFASVTESFAETTIDRFFNAGSFVGLICRGHDRSPRYVDVHDVNRPWLRLCRDLFWSDGTLARRDHFDETGQSRYREYIDESGRTYVSSWVTPAGYEYRTVEYAADGTATLFKDMRFSNSAWLRRKLAEIGPSVVFTDEPRTTFALEIDSPLVHHVTTIHVTHFKNNQDRTDGLKNWMGHYIQFKQNVSDFVLLTEAQRLDFIKDAGVPSEHVSVIPHAAPSERSTVTPPHMPTLVSVGRLADEKRVEDAITAFSRHCREIPNVRFKIYGAGPAEERLKNLVSTHDLDGIVTFEGLTKDPLKAFAEANCSILSSKYEGFGLVITESFAMGTPVVAYDVIYGARDLIVNGKNGLLVGDGDIDALGKSVHDILTDVTLQARLRSGAVETADKFSEDEWEDTWNRKITLLSENLQHSRV